MKKLILCSLALASISFTSVQNSNATDLVVAAGGSGGAYASIGAAVTAASPGDRIIVYPQPGGASYSEGTLSITKSLQIVSANEGAYYAVDGQINVTPATAGMSLTIIGMKLFTGNITATAAAPTGARCVVNILNDSLAQGGIGFAQNNYDLTVASSYIQDGIAFRFGKVLGNVLNANVAVTTDASVNNPNDTILIIGNKISYYYGSTASGGIAWSSTSQYFSIQNNYIKLTYPGYNVDMGVYITNSKASSAGKNTITNNTVYKPSPYTIYYGYAITTNANAYTEVNNNLQLGPIYGGGFSVGGGTYSVHYNMTNTLSFSGFTNDGTNIAQTNTTLNADGLNTNPLSNTINGGNPDSAYVDIDLTRNDVGCYGGSFTLDNFFPITANDWARVMLVTAPRRVLVNGTISVKAVGFDK